MNSIKIGIFVAWMSICTFSSATIVINVPTCTVDSQCDRQSHCTFICQFAGLNTAGTIMKIVPGIGTSLINKNQIAQDTGHVIYFQKKTWQHIVMYQPTVGRVAGKTISLLFYNIDLRDSAALALLPKSVRSDIENIRAKHPNIAYVLFVLKELRKNIYQEISATYIDSSSPSDVAIPININPDGNIHITIPSTNVKSPSETLYIRIDQIS